MLGKHIIAELYPRLVVTVDVSWSPCFLSCDVLECQCFDNTVVLALLIPFWS